MHVRSVVDGGDIYVHLDDLLIALAKLRIDNPDEDRMLAIIETGVADWGTRVVAARDRKTEEETYD